METKSSNNKTQTILVVVDVLIYVIVTATYIAIKSSDGLELFQTGFFCDDQSLMYPFREDTVSSKLVTALAVLVFPILVLLLQVANALTKGEPCRRYFDKAVASDCYSVIGMYLFGGSITLLMVEILKILIGRPRPYFFEGCKPNYNFTENCTTLGYISTYICTNTDAEILSDIRKSFPSAHAAVSVYAVLYIVIYLDLAVRRRWAVFRLLCPVIQMILVMSALYICALRIHDNKHHPGDVIAGGLMGVTGCLITAFILSDLRVKCSKMSEKNSDNVPSVENQMDRYTDHNKEDCPSVSCSLKDN